MSSYCRLLAAFLTIMSVMGLSHDGRQPINQETRDVKDTSRKKIRPILDQYGDRLPYGAIARLGTSRLRHWGSVTSLAFSPDSKILYSAASDDVVRSWQLPDGKPLRTFSHKDGRGNFLAVSPDGTRLVTTGKHNGGILLWNTKTGQLVRAFRKEAGGTHDEGAMFSPDGTKLAGIRNGRQVYVWDLAQLEKSKSEEEIEGVKLETPEAGIDFLFFTRDGKTLISVGPDSTVRFWNVADGKEMQKQRITFKEQLASAAFDQEKGSLAVRERKGTVRVYDIEKGRLLREMQSPNAWALALPPGGKTLVISKDKVPGRPALVFWDIAQGTKIKEIRFSGQPLHTCAISPDGRFLAGADNFNSIRLWDLKSGQELLANKGHSWIGGFAVSANGEKLALGTNGGVQLWDVPSGKKGAFFPEVGPAVALSKDGTLLYSHKKTSTGDAEIIALSTTSGKQHITTSVVYGMTSPVLGLSSDGNWLFSWERILQDEIYVWNARIGKVSCKVSPGRQNGRDFFSPSFVPGKTIFALGEAPAKGYTVYFFDAKTGKEIRSIKQARPDVLSGTSCSLSFSRDGKTMAVNVKEIDLWEVFSGKHLRSISAPGWARAFSPDGKVLALTTRSGLLFYEIASGGKIGALDAKMTQKFADFLPDGRTVVSTSADNSVLLWDWLKCAQPEACEKKPGNAEATWKALASQNVPDAYRAIAFLLENPKETISLLGKKLRKGHPLNKDAIGKLVLDLDRTEFNVRAKADKQLEKLGPAAKGFLRKALTEGKFSLEGRKRIDRLLGLLKSPAPEWLRSYRAIQVLELIEVTEAGKILQALADDWLFDEALRSVYQGDAAKAALSRWQDRTKR